MPKLTGILETVLYVTDLETAATFYREVMGLSCTFDDFRMRAFDVGGNGVLLLFPRGGSLQPIETLGGQSLPTMGPGRCTSRSRFQKRRRERVDWSP